MSESVFDGEESADQQNGEYQRQPVEIFVDKRLIGSPYFHINQLIKKNAGPG